MRRFQSARGTRYHEHSRFGGEPVARGKLSLAGKGRVQLGNLIRHVSNYSLGSLVVTLAGLISFPILTRVLGVDDYGNMSLVAVTLTFLVAAGKLGLQHSAIMFYSDTRAGRNAWNVDQYYSSLLCGMCLSGAVVSLSWLMLTLTAGKLFWDAPGIIDILILVSPLVLLRVIQSALNGILRAQEKSAQVSLFSVLWRYGNLVLVISGLLLVDASLKVFFIATIISEALVLALMAYKVLGHVNVSRAHFSPALYRSMVWFGLPMLGYEMAGIFANVGDRYVIKLLLGAEELGKYAAAYNLSEYVSSVIVVSLATAILPMYMRIWADKGREETEQFVSKSLQLYVFAALPVGFGFSAVATDFISIMASPVFREGAVTIPYIIAGMIVEGAVVMLAAGLYVKKESRKLMVALATASLMNLLMNLALVPAMGIRGAAVATLLTYILFAVFVFYGSSRHMTIMLPWRQVLRYGTYSLLMYLLVIQVSHEQVVLSLVAKVLVGGAVYCLLALGIDRDGRRLLWQILGRGE